MAAASETRILVVGSGFGGLGTAIRLKQRGVEDFVILERADDVGGTWRDNTYPGCACDVPSHLYSFSFALNPDWSHSYSRQPEIWDYLKRCAREFGVLPHVRFGTEVRSAEWRDGRWHVVTSRGPWTASILVAATGPLSEPRKPDLPGIDSFEGRAFHSARWDHGYDLVGKRVAVIGTGASAIQFVPEIQPRVAKLHLFQRTAPWVLRRPGRALTGRERRFFRRVPLAQRALRSSIYLARELLFLAFRYPRLMRVVQRLALRHLRRSISDPALRAKLTPDYVMGCKRVLLSNDYYPAIAKGNVEVVTERIREVRARSIVTADGAERPVDAIILGTGFTPTEPPIARHVKGRDGRTLAEVWGGSPKAYAGTTVAGFPNLFLLFGPNTGLGHSSAVFMMEAQIEHFLRALDLMRDGAAIEPTEEAQAAFVEEVDRKMRGTVWTSGRCRSWYLDRTGRNSTLWPDFTWRFRDRVAHPRAEDYRVVERSLSSPSLDTAVRSREDARVSRGG